MLYHFGIVTQAIKEMRATPLTVRLVLALFTDVLVDALAVSVTLTIYKG